MKTSAGKAEIRDSNWVPPDYKSGASQGRAKLRCSPCRDETSQGTEKYLRKLKIIYPKIMHSNRYEDNSIVFPVPNHNAMKRHRGEEWIAPAALTRTAPPLKGKVVL
jgi:hypothetical protein